jgi:hypothetical protein
MLDQEEAEMNRRHRMLAKARKAMAEVNWNEQHRADDHAG